jgi:microcompartment protein CcmK/EutM
MRLARVIGTVVATRKADALANLKILMIQPVDEKQKESGAPLAAVDTVQAGPGDLVCYTMAREAALALPDPVSPVDAAITGIVDQVNVEERGIADRESIFGPAGKKRVKP